MNIITITGNLGKDAEQRFLPDGTGVVSFSVADSQGKEKPAIWWNCSLFGKRGDSLLQYLIKGQQVTVAGNVTEREYTDKNGQERKGMSIRVIDIALQGGKPQGDRAQEDKQAKQKPADTGSGFDDLDSDIPF